MQQSEAFAGADLESIMATIANSPIVARRGALEALLADWENTRRSPHVDDVVLDWLASHAHQRKRVALS
jgi:hypothetical protein